MRAPEYPLERVCSHLYEPFPLKFARHAQQLLQEVKEIRTNASHAGLVMLAETEAAFESPVAVLRDYYGDQIRVGPAAIRYHHGLTLEQPHMGVRVRCRAADLEGVKADLEARQAAILDSKRTPAFGLVRATAPLAQLLGYAQSLARLTDGTAHEYQWLSHYAPVETPPPGNDAA